MKVENTNKVKIHYKGTLSDGQVFDSSEGRDPLEFQVGAKQVIPGFEEAVLGMTKGEKKTITIPSEKAYGPIRAEMVQEVPKKELPQGMEIKVGTMLMLQTPQGQQMPVKVAKVSDETVTMDLNHPLAGKDLTFEIEVVDVQEGGEVKEHVHSENCNH